MEEAKGVAEFLGQFDWKMWAGAALLIIIYAAPSPDLKLKLWLRRWLKR